MVSLAYCQEDAGHLRNEFLLSFLETPKAWRGGEFGNGNEAIFSLPLARDCRRRGTVVSAWLRASDCTLRITCWSRPVLQTVAFSIAFQTEEVCK